MMKFYIGSGFKNYELVNYYSKVLEKNGWHHTYNWAKNFSNNETIDDLIEYAKLEQTLGMLMLLLYYYQQEEELILN